MAGELTITVDDDVAEKLRRAAQRTGTTTQEIANETLRRELDEPDMAPLAPFRIEARPLRAREGVSFECIGLDGGES